jgi:hypothetical protein
MIKTNPLSHIPPRYTVDGAHNELLLRPEENKGEIKTGDLL